jgi:hypothetical protein
VGVMGGSGDGGGCRVHLGGEGGIGTVEPVREPPVRFAEQFHRRWDDDHAYERRVDEHRGGEAEQGFEVNARPSA